MVAWHGMASMLVCCLHVSLLGVVTAHHPEGKLDSKTRLDLFFI